VFSGWNSLPFAYNKLSLATFKRTLKCMFSDSIDGVNHPGVVTFCVAVASLTRAALTYLLRFGVGRLQRSDENDDAV